MSCSCCHHIILMNYPVATVQQQTVRSGLMTFTVLRMFEVGRAFRGWHYVTEGSHLCCPTSNIGAQI